MTPRSPGARENVALVRLGSLKLASNGFACTFGVMMFTTGTLCAVLGAVVLPGAAHTAAGLVKILRIAN